MALVAVLRLAVPEEVWGHDALDVVVGDGRLVVHVLEYRKLSQQAQKKKNQINIKVLNCTKSRCT